MSTLNGPRIVFAGSPAFALPTLETLLQLGHRPVAVLTQPDRPAGRGRHLSQSPVKQLATATNLPVLQPDTLRDASLQQVLRGLAPDLFIVVAYGQLLPPAVLAIPRLGCVNVHASILPRWRGASPIQTAILAGDRTTGVSIMAMEAGLDTGPVYARASIPIGNDETAGELEQRLARLGADTLAEALGGIISGGLPGEPQDPAAATWAGRISKADARIDWDRPAPAIARLVRAYNPRPVAETTCSGKQLRCFQAVALDENFGQRAEAGTVVAAGPSGIDVQTGAGTLRIMALQLEGRQRMSAAAFAQGTALEGRILGG